MPFTKTNGKYKSPSGKTFTKKQVTAYYATNGFSKGVRTTAKSQQTRKARGNRAGSK